MMVIYSGRRSQFWIALAAALMLTTSCSTGGPAPPVNGQQFTGNWSYGKACDSGHYVNLILNQTDGHVSGQWSAGTNIRGSDGQLNGVVRDDRLYVLYCSDDGEIGYEACPRFGGEEDYFVLRHGMLVRFMKYGADYRQDISLHPDVPGKEVPLDSDTCDITEEQL